MRVVVIALCLVMVAAAACSPESLSGDPPIIPADTMSIDFTTTWTPAGDLGDVEEAVTAELGAAGLFAIVPPDLPEWQDSSGELRISRSGPAPDLRVDMTVRSDAGEVILSTSGMSVANFPSCQDRLDGYGGVDGWQVVKVRMTTGCVATNTVGLSFIEWVEEDLWWHAETRMDPLTALNWLTGWTSLS